VTLLVDDRVLAAHLRGRRGLSSTDEAVFTTGYWYVRLCLAVSRRAGGSPSGPFAALPPARGTSAIAAVLELPAEIGLLSLRRLGPRIGELAARHPPMNVLTREALAAAVELSARVVVAEGNENPALLAALDAEGLRVAIVPTP
jgi:hypothetical protein